MVHDPALGEVRARGRVRGGQRHRVPTSGAAVVEIATVADVLQLVNVVIADTWLQENSAARSRALLAAGDLALRALSVGEIEARLAALEGALLNGRPSAPISSNGQEGNDERVEQTH